jgi:hypothetical protein
MEATAVAVDNSHCLGDEGGGGGSLVAPGGGQDTDSLVVTGQTVDTGLNQNEAELGVLILAVALKVLADGDSLVITNWLAFTAHGLETPGGLVSSAPS